MLRRFGEIMSVAPEFELGLLNAWILWVPLLVTLLLLSMMKKGASVGLTCVPCKSKITRLVAALGKISYFPAGMYSVFSPLQ